MADNYLQYARLAHIAKTNKPYRKSTDRFPLSYRQHSYKCFFVKQDENGDDEYHIAYHHRYREQSITKTQFDNEKVNNHLVRDRGNGNYFMWVKDWDIVGVVRKDNTFEFTTNQIHQGTRQFLASMFNVYYSEVVSSIKHGGAIYREYERDEEKTNAKQANRVDNRWCPTYYKDTKVIPLFKGQRIDLATNSSVINYEVHLPYVNRKRSKEVMVGYKDTLGVAELFFKTMTGDVFRSEMREVYDEVYADMETKPSWRDNEAADKLMAYTKSQINNDMYKAMYATMMYSGSLNAWSIGTNNQYYNNDRYEPHQYFKYAKDKIIKQLKLENNVHDIKTFKANEAYPTNTWEVKVLVDGKQVRVY